MNRAIEDRTGEGRSTRGPDDGKFRGDMVLTQRGQDERRGGASPLIPSLLACILVALVVLIGLQVIRRGSGGPAQTATPAAQPGPAVADGQTVRRAELADPPAVPKPVGDPDRIRETARAGKTYQVALKAGLDARVEDKAWGPPQDREPRLRRRDAGRPHRRGQRRPPGRRAAALRHSAQRQAPLRRRGPLDRPRPARRAPARRARTLSAGHDRGVGHGPAHRRGPARRGSPGAGPESRHQGRRARRLPVGQAGADHLRRRRGRRVDRAGRVRAHGPGAGLRLRHGGPLRLLHPPGPEGQARPDLVGWTGNSWRA